VNRRELVEQKMTRRSTRSMRLLLTEFCTEFLTGAYNHLMRIVKVFIFNSRLSLFQSRRALRGVFPIIPEFLPKENGIYFIIVGSTDSGAGSRE